MVTEAVTDSAPPENDPGVRVTVGPAKKSATFNTVLLKAGFGLWGLVFAPFPDLVTNTGSGDQPEPAGSNVMETLMAGVPPSEYE